MNDISKKAEEFALSEIEKYGLPSLINFKTSNKKGLELAKKLGVNSEIVEIGTRLMDIKLGEASSKGKLNEHIEMSVEATRKFLSKFNISKDVIEKIVNCVEGHHGTKEWKCKEAEVCANADCYRFLLVRNWLEFLNSLSARKTTFDENLQFAEEKAEEKWKVLSLRICKIELEPHYKLIREIIEKARSLENIGK